MHIVFFAHPNFLGHQSMPRFAKMLADGMQRKGHEVEVWSPQEKFRKFFSTNLGKKWFGYMDQYVVFPLQLRNAIKKVPLDTLFVFTDQALGPWVPMVASRPHVIHCHDFLAQLSALGKIPENPTGWTGIQYQKFIRKGYSKGDNFISVSKKTKEHLHQFLNHTPAISEVVYNGLNRNFKPGDIEAARDALSTFAKVDLTRGYILHVGGNQWYKNRYGLLLAYDAWRKSSDKALPLICIGASPDDALLGVYSATDYPDDIHFLEFVPDDLVKMAYIGASLFLFPSLAEGFGWPIAEAMASGCPVITTNKRPMTEVTKGVGRLIEKMPKEISGQVKWAEEVAKTIEEVLSLQEEERLDMIENQIINAKRFDQEKSLDLIENIYKRVLEEKSL